jgi:hypothetical protein
MSSGTSNSSSYFSMESQTSPSGGFLSPLDIPMDAPYQWEDQLEITTATSMAYSETAGSTSMDLFGDYDSSMIFEKYVASPNATDFQHLTAASLSPEIHPKDEPSPSSPDSQESEDMLEDYLTNLKPTDGKYRCFDVQAEDHVCDYAAERKCMLRFV